METYNGHVRTPTDAIILFEACRIGLLPRVQRRLSEKERQSIKSGSVFVWDEREAGMRRWTDGKSWSASRVSGSFLTYREMEGKRGGNSFDKTANRDGASNKDADSEGDGPDGYRYKLDGLMKQSFSITTNNDQHLHLISYFARSSANQPNLMQPSNDPQLRHIRPEKGMYPDSTVHEQNNIPAVTRGPMSSPGYTHSPNQPPYNRGAPQQYYSHPTWAPPSPMHTPPPHPSYQPYYQQPAYHHGPPAPYQSGPPPHGYAPPPSLPPYDRSPQSAHGGPPPAHHYSHAQPPQHSYYQPLPPPPQQYSNGHAPYRPPPVQTSAYTAPISAPHAPESRPHLDAQHPQSYEKPRTDSHQDQKQPSPPRVHSETQTSTAQTIPSISAMLNGTDPVPPARSSQSPGGTLRVPLQDIPSHKLGFEARRDIQAVRTLDKTTFKGY